MTDNCAATQQPLKSSFNVADTHTAKLVNRLQKGSTSNRDFNFINIKLPCWILACLICCKMCKHCVVCKCYCCDKNNWDSMCIKLTDAIFCVDSGCCTC